MNQPINAPARATCVAILAIGLTAGCGGESTAPAGGMSELEKLANQQAEQAAAAEEAKVAAVAESKRQEAAKLADEGPSAVTMDDFSRGDKLKGSGALVTPLKAGIRAEQKLNMFTVTHALNLFYGLEGRYPESHEEFMEKVVDFNNIELEPLEEPYEYWYNAETNELWKRVKPDVAASAAEEAES
ncbi:MAG: hypothetical protein AAFV43_06260 [Planctomycetota bacterium]